MWLRGAGFCVAPDGSLNCTLAEALQRASHRALQYRTFLDTAAAFYDTQGTASPLPVAWFPTDS